MFVSFMLVFYLLFILIRLDVWVDLQHDLTRMADKACSSVVLAQLQIAFTLECDN